MKPPKKTLPHEEPEWYAHWWRRSPVVQVNAKGKTAAKPDADFWFEHFWKPRELAVWIYELVRRLPKTRMGLQKKQIKSLQAMPPYPKLSPEQRAVLVFAITRELDPKLIGETTSMQFDSTSREMLQEWQRGQHDKLADWRQIESLDKLSGSRNEGGKELRWDKRRRARARAETNLPLVLTVWTLMSTVSRRNLMVPRLQNSKPHSLTGAVFSEAELQAICGGIKPTV